MDWARHMRVILNRLGEDVVWRPADGRTTTTLRAVYIEPDARVLDIVASTRPQLGVMTADCTELADGDFIELRGDEYRVNGPTNPDPVSGLTVCALEATL